MPDTSDATDTGGGGITTASLGSEGSSSTVGGGLFQIRFFILTLSFTGFG
jgi:hypothetical protein